jgi:hypothetical protein
MVPNSMKELRRPFPLHFCAAMNRRTPKCGTFH